MTTGNRLAIALVLLAGCERVIEPTFAGPERWASVPIGVAVSEDFDWDGELDGAIRLWNDAAGCELFEANQRGMIRVSIGEDSSMYPERRGWVQVYAADGYITRAEITIHGVADTRTAYLAIAHELGGAVMLEHDRTTAISIMHPTIASRSSGVVMVTRKDAKALNARYCR